MTLCIVRNTWNFARFIITKVVDNVPCRRYRIRKSTTPIENGHGREEDIDLLWSIQSKKETQFVH
jgi:NADH-quinone oxidoreductase subunit F